MPPTLRGRALVYIGMLLFHVQKSANTETDQSQDRIPNYHDISQQSQTGSRSFSAQPGLEAGLPKTSNRRSSVGNTNKPAIASQSLHVLSR